MESELSQKTLTKIIRYKYVLPQFYVTTERYGRNYNFTSKIKCSGQVN